MPKASKPAPSSPFDALLDVRSRTAKQPDVQEPESSEPASPPSGAKLAKSVDPAYTKFTSYIRKQTHRAVKIRLVSQSREMSDLVEELLTEWLAKESSH